MRGRALWPTKARGLAIKMARKNPFSHRRRSERRQTFDRVNGMREKMHEGGLDCGRKSDAEKTGTGSFKGEERILEVGPREHRDS